MKKIIWILGILIASGFAAKAFFFSEEEFLSVLVFSKTESFRHESIEAGQTAIQELGKKHGFDVALSEDSELFNEDDLQKYNVVVFLNTTLLIQSISVSGMESRKERILMAILITLMSEKQISRWWIKAMGQQRCWRMSGIELMSGTTLKISILISTFS